MKVSSSFRALRFLQWFCPPHLREEIEGDLIQRYERDIKTSGRKVANRKLFINSIRFLRPGILLRNKFSFSLIQWYMILSYIKIAFRNFQRQKGYTLLNVVGLSLGLAASLLIFQYVKYERSFDRFHSRADDIYRIQYNGWQNGQLNFESAVAVPASAAALKNNFPEVEAFTRFLPIGGVLVYERQGEEPLSIRIRKGQYADTSLFTVFDFKLLQGDKRNCLKGLYKTILSQSLAEKYFGDEDPIGKRLRLNGDDNALEVTGVFRDVPENSHIKFDFLVSYETINSKTDNASETAWGWYDFYSFILLKPGTNIKGLQAKWDQYVAEVRKESWEKSNYKQEFILRPLTDIHLYSHLLYETSPEDLRDGDSVYALSFMALFILIIAWVNYINLATARSFKRANEVGVRKVVGAFRTQLIGQFITESLILNVIAAILALGMVGLLWVPFSQLTGWNIPMDFLLQREFWFLVIGLFAGGAILSGFYPAIILSSFKPVSVLKGKVIRSSAGNFLRIGLVGFQFVASVFLISGSLIVYQQLKFMKNKDLGVDIDKTLVLKGPSITDSLYNRSYEAFKTEILHITGVKSISASTSIPGEENYWTTSIRRLSGGPKGSNVVTSMRADQEFIKQYQIGILAGRDFDVSQPGDRRKLIINESLLKQLQFVSPEQAVGEKVIVGRDTVEVIGVIQDFHQMSLKSEIIPLMMWYGHPASFFSLKLETSNYQNIIQAIEKPWKEFFHENPIDYFFLDQFYNRQYVRDDRFGQVFTIFTFLGIFIASLGLLGLASFMALQRTREIGIRKVMGSSVSGIIVLLSKVFMRPVLVAIIIACPIGWWLMEKWLQSFPYRTNINWWVFVVSGLLVLVVAFLSVASQTLKAALTKPAETLKYE